MQSISRNLALVAALAVLAGCSMGGGSSSPVTATTLSGGQVAAPAAFVIFIPNSTTGSSTSRRPKFVSPSTLGITINNFQHLGTTPVYTTSADLSAGSAACTAVTGGRNCTVTITAVGGNDDFTFATYDVTPSNGTFGTASHQLGTASLSNITILVGQSNTINVALSGIISTIKLSVGQPTIFLPSAKTFNVGVTALDIDNNIILAGLTTVSNGGVQQTDTYANSIGLSVAESGAGAGTGHTKLALNGGAATNAVTLTKSSDVVTLTYDGSAAANTYAVQLSGSATGVAATISSINFMSISAAGAGVFVGGANPSLSFSAPGQVETITLIEPNYFGRFTATLPNIGTANCPNTSITLNTGALLGSGTTFTVTAGTANAIVCSIAASDNITASATLGMSSSVTGSGGIIVPVPNNALYATAFGTTGSASSVAALNPSAAATPVPVNPTVIRLNLADGTTTSSISGNLTQLREPIGVGHDTSGNVYVADALAGSIFKFAAGSSGNVAPTATITSASLFQPDGLAVDSSGKIYVTDYLSGNILVFAANASGNSVPVSTMTGIAAVGDIKLDSAGDIYVITKSVGAGGATTLASEYAAPAAGTTAPTAIRTITTVQNAASAVAIDPSGNVFVADYQTPIIEEYGAGGSSVTPIATFSPNGSSAGPAPGFGFPPGFGGIAVDGAGHLYALGFANGAGLMQYATWQISTPATNPTINTFATPNLSGTHSQVGLMDF